MQHPAAAAALSLCCLWFAQALAQEGPRETPAQMRRIVAQSVCLAVAYPEQRVGQDAEDVIALYQGLLQPPISARQLGSVREHARDARPAAPSPVGQRNLALARCALFADRPDIQALLGARAR